MFTSIRSAEGLLTVSPGRACRTQASKSGRLNTCTRKEYEWASAAPMRRTAGAALLAELLFSRPGPRLRPTVAKELPPTAGTTSTPRQEPNPQKRTINQEGRLPGILVGIRLMGERQKKGLLAEPKVDYPAGGTQKSTTCPGQVVLETLPISPARA
ncbi:hypothetical protein GCM10022408_17330 [Hymenobacter fastidiosus]|uniref:Uncharacterized protein n=1 Tax=Hymenobacter fastidiosus TaxID=486264 RepID=A0ABP7S3F4_9BACT